LLHQAIETPPVHKKTLFFFLLGDFLFGFFLGCHFTITSLFVQPERRKTKKSRPACAA